MSKRYRIWLTLALAAVLSVGMAFAATKDKCGKKGSCSGTPPVPVNMKTYVGTDCDGAGVPGLYVPNVCTIGEDEELWVEENMGNCPNNYVSGGYLSADTIANMEDPHADEPTMLGAYEAWDDCLNMVTLLAELEAAADHVCEGDSCAMPSGLSAESLTFIKGNFTSSADGRGLLVVTGTFEYDTGASFDGIILVVGQGEFVRTGSGGNGVITGATVVADINGADDTLGTADDCEGTNNDFGTAKYHEALQQQGDTIYCSTDINDAMQVRTFDIKHFRQR